jgi:hypothetical protein
MTESLVIPARFCGPPDSGNGGYVCGRVAGYLSDRVTVTLRKPPPVETPLAVERDGAGSVRVLDGGTLVAEAVSSADDAAAEENSELPAPVSIAEARAAGSRCRLRAHPEEHPFPTCFVCGPDRGPADGLHILVGPVAGRDLSADLWYPDENLAGPDGDLRSEFLWAALDCASGVGALGNDEPSGPPWVLGRFTVQQIGPVKTSEPHVVVGWRVAQDGRKLLAGAALFTAAGQAVGAARATWIRLR